MNNKDSENNAVIQEVNESAISVDYLVKELTLESSNNNFVDF